MTIYSRCMITATKEYPETSACKVTEELLYRLGGTDKSIRQEIKIVVGDDYEDFKSFNPTYIANFGGLHPINAIERLLHSKTELLIEVFRLTHEWHLYRPEFGIWELPYQEWLYTKMKEAGMQHGRFGNNHREVMYWSLQNPRRELFVYPTHYRGPIG